MMQPPGLRRLQLTSSLMALEALELLLLGARDLRLLRVLEPGALTGNEVAEVSVGFLIAGLVFVTAAAVLAWAALKVGRGRVTSVVRGVGITIPAALVVLFTLSLGEGLWLRWFLAIVVLLSVALTLGRARNPKGGR